MLKGSLVVFGVTFFLHVKEKVRQSALLPHRRSRVPIQTMPIPDAIAIRMVNTLSIWNGPPIKIVRSAMPDKILPKIWSSLPAVHNMISSTIGATE